MASTPEGRALTEAHRLAQVRIGAQTVEQAVTSFELLDPSALDATFPRWLRIMRPIIARQRDQSAALAANYLTTFRTLELGQSVSPFPAILAGPADEQAVATSLLVTGPANIRSSLAKGVPFSQAVDGARAASAGASMRHALDGGRETVTLTVVGDPRAKGWARVASGKPCSFCAMLAGRGPVYSDQTVKFRSHDHCSCSAEPVYRDAPRSQWPPGSARFRDIYDEAAKGLPADEARNAFRRALAGG